MLGCRVWTQDLLMQAPPSLILFPLVAVLGSALEPGAIQVRLGQHCTQRLHASTTVESSCLLDAFATLSPTSLRQRRATSGASLIHPALIFFTVCCDCTPL